MGIISTRRSGYDCYDQILASIMNYCEMPDSFPMVFASRWWFDFDFANTSKHIGDRIQVRTGYRDYLYEIGGIRQVYYSFDKSSESIREFIDLLESETDNGRPVIGFVDSFYSPWDSHYHRIHGGHALIFLGIDKDKQKVYCSDRYYSSKIESVDISSLPQLCNRYILHQIVKRPEMLSVEQCEDIVRLHMRYIADNDVFQKIRDFALYLKDNLNIQSELYGYDFIERTPLITQLNDLGYGRESFTRALEYIKMKFRKYDLDYFIDEISIVARKWRDLALLLGKYSMSRKKDLNVDRLVSSIKGFADVEEKIANELLQYLDHKTTVEAVQFTEYNWNRTAESDRFEQLDISEFMNNRAFAKKVENIEKANYNNSDEFMALKNPVNDHTLKYGNITFRVGIDDFSVQFDNFACDEQTIEVTSDYYTDIYFVASAQYVNQKSNITVIYEDNSAEDLLFCVSDWRSKCVFGEQTIYEAISCRIVNEVKTAAQGNAYLYLQGIELRSDKKIQAIKLPYHTNIHLYAMGISNKFFQR